jgi:hypothetical protein
MVLRSGCKEYFIHSNDSSHVPSNPGGKNEIQPELFRSIGSVRVLRSMQQPPLLTAMQRAAILP